MPVAARFVIISKDSVFCLGVKEGLKALPTVDMVVQVANQHEAENKIARRVSTVLLVDVDSVDIDLALMVRMVSRFNNVLVVFTALREIKAKHLMTSKIKDFVQKPDLRSPSSVNRYLRLILMRMGGFEFAGQAIVNYKDVSKTVNASDKIVAIASSTGGVEALEKILAGLPAEMPPMLLVQHMPSGFTNFFANRLDGKYPLNIKEAQTGDFLMRRQLLIAPSGTHMKLVQKQGKLAVECFLGPKMHGVIPAADILFESIANILKKNAVGVILTGMGADGGRGLMLMHNNGAKTIGQNKETCVVYGMPKVAKDLGAIDYELPIDKIAGKILSLV